MLSSRRELKPSSKARKLEWQRRTAKENSMAQVINKDKKENRVKKKQYIRYECSINQKTYQYVNLHEKLTNQCLLFLVFHHAPFRHTQAKSFHATQRVHPSSICDNTSQTPMKGQLSHYDYHACWQEVDGGQSATPSWWLLPADCCFCFFFCF